MEVVVVDVDIISTIVEFASISWAYNGVCIQQVDAFIWICKIFDVAEQIGK